ncbi:M16 family metallopeptidase [Brumimicrobium aurantiacum]|uniref:Insulinase family protein n=1 Tax=Brumimicrobium aurantiacum TaxID=1737063 RepID=A0A3E1EYE4_9FLAO|nr:pitrilysin family protein [Brumimicrobium aurantiacum]RFC54566.1 insulinase family protein [Brumimicrobium aurantiacum]
MNVEPTIFQLDNGIRVVYLQDPSMVAHLGVTVRAGSRFESENEEGLAHFLEHCIFKGTKNRRAFHVLSRLDSVGGELNAYTTKEEICVYSSFTKEHLKRASDLLADILFNSTFPSKEVEKEKEVVLDEINSYLDSPSDKIFDDFESHLFPNNPLGNNILGTVESVQSFTKADLERYVKKFFYPENMVISFVGNLKSSVVLKQLNKDFGHYSHKEDTAQPTAPKELEAFNIESPEANYQSHLMIGGRAPGYNHPGRRVFNLLINILGGPALNSRLGLSIREKYGYTYNIDASYTPFEEVGYWNVYAGTDPKYQKKTLRLIKKEIQRFIDEPLTENQLKKAKQQMKGHLALGMDSNSGVMLNFGKSLLVFNQIDTLEEIYESIDSITPEEIQSIAQEFMSNDQVSSLVFSVKK